MAPCRVAIVSGARSLQPMGLESAERRLLEVLRARPDAGGIELRIVGGRAARRYARSVGGRWYPARPGRASRRALRSARLVHLIGLDLPPPQTGPFVATVHDLAAMRFGDEGRLPPWAADTAARAERVVTPSAFTGRELQELLRVPLAKIRVVPNGPGNALSQKTQPLTDGALAELGLSRPFVLRMGGYTARKNVPKLLAAWPEVHRRTRAQLALVGPPQRARAAQLAQAPSLDGVVVLDYIPSTVVPGLIRAAHLLASPSAYEGFGLPPLEAMGAGVPVVGVRAAAVEEVCGPAALLVDDDAAALADALVRALEDDALRQRLRAAGLQRAAGFSWARAAGELLAVYRELEA